MYFTYAVDMAKLKPDSQLPYGAIVCLHSIPETIYWEHTDNPDIERRCGLYACFDPVIAVKSGHHWKPYQVRKYMCKMLILNVKQWIVYMFG